MKMTENHLLLIVFSANQGALLPPNGEVYNTIDFLLKEQSSSSSTYSQLVVPHIRQSVFVLPHL